MPADFIPSPESEQPDWRTLNLACLVGRRLAHPECVPNQDLLTFIFGEREDAERPMIAAIKGAPSPGSSGWNARPWWPDVTAEDARLNWYMTLSTFVPSEPAAQGEPTRRGEWLRREKYFAAQYGFMLDDVKDWQALPLAPTWALETSPGNFQAVYLLDRALRDVVMVNAIGRALLAKGWSDPNAGSPPTRYLRLPRAINGKRQPHFECRMHMLDPAARFSVEQLVAGLQLQLTPEAPRAPLPDASTLTGDLAEVRELGMRIARENRKVRTTREGWVDYLHALRGATSHDPEAGLAIAILTSWHDTQAEVDETVRVWHSIRPGELHIGMDALRTMAQGQPDPTTVFQQVESSEAVQQLQGAAAPAVTDEGFQVLDDMGSEEPGAYIIKGMLGMGDFCLVYGVTGAGKTFLMVSLALHLAARLAWMGARIAPDLGVVIVANEGHAGVKRRIYATARSMGLTGRGLPIAVTSRTAILAGQTQKEAEALVLAMIRRVLRMGAKHVVVIFDTLAATWAGLDENEAKGLGVVIAQMNRVKGTLITPMVIHHPGKDLSRGPRGHSSLMAAADTVWSVERNADDSRALTVEKQRDGECGVPMNFRLAPFEVGHDSDGDRVTTCAVEFLGRAAKQAPRAQASPLSRLRPNQRLAFDCLAAAVAKDGQPFDSDTPSGRVKAVSRAVWAEQFLQEYLLLHGEDTRKARNAARTGFTDALQPLLNCGLVCHEMDQFWISDFVQS